MVDFMSTCVVQVFPFEVNFRTLCVVCQAFRKIKGRGATGVLFQVIGKIPLKGFGWYNCFIGFSEFGKDRNQGFRYVTAAKRTKKSGKFLSLCRNRHSILLQKAAQRQNLFVLKIGNRFDG